MGEGRAYETAIIIGVLVVCLLVLGARWRVLAQRVPLVYPAAAEYSAEIPATSAAAGGGGAGGADSRTASANQIDINRASATELERLPGIGPVLAGRIVAWRKAHGPFRSLDELRRVSGIGDKKLAALRGQAVCSGGD